MFSTKNKTLFLMFLVLASIMTTYMTSLVKYYDISVDMKIFLATLFGAALGVLMTREISEKPTTLLRVQLFAGYLICYLTFRLGRILIRQITDTDYVAIYAASVFIIAVLALFAAEKTWMKDIGNQPPLLNPTRYIE